VKGPRFGAIELSKRLSEHLTLVEHSYANTLRKVSVA
jgi:hypothetical protein